MVASLAASRPLSVVSFSSIAFIAILRTPRTFPSAWILNFASPNNSEDYSSSETSSFESVKPTWAYVPYNQNRPATANNLTPSRRRYFSDWTVPKTIDIPQDKLDIQFVRSSGAGGQNVNKVNTKVEIRLDVMGATWIPQEVRERLQQQQSNRINKDGVLSLTSQEYRTQGQNKKAALDKLQAMVLEAWPRPRVRKQRTGVSKVAKERNKDFKKKRSETKRSRGRVDW